MVPWPFFNIDTDNNFSFKKSLSSLCEVCRLEEVPAELRTGTTPVEYFQILDDTMFDYGLRNGDILTVEKKDIIGLGDFVIISKDGKYYLRLNIETTSSENADPTGKITGTVIACNRFLD